MTTTTTHSHHVPVAHPLFLILRIAQLILAVVLLGLLAYLGWAYNTAYGSFTSVYSGAIGVGLFTACLTIILGIYYFVASLAVPNAYNKWAIIALEAGAALFWLISFALIADCVAGLIAAENYVSSYSGYTYCDSDGYCYKRLGKRGPYDTWNSIWYSSLAFSVVEWVLFMVTLVLFALSLHKHRRSTATTAGTAELGHETKHTDAGPMPAEPMPAPEYQHQQPMQQQVVDQHPVQHNPVQQHPVQEQPMH